jgi:hypothetical protein
MELSKDSSEGSVDFAEELTSVLVHSESCK